MHLNYQLIFRNYNKICLICSHLEKINHVQLNHVVELQNSTKEVGIVLQTFNVTKEKHDIVYYLERIHLCFYAFWGRRDRYKMYTNKMCSCYNYLLAHSLFYSLINFTHVYIEYIYICLYMDRWRDIDIKPSPNTFNPYHELFLFYISVLDTILIEYTNLETVQNFVTFQPIKRMQQIKHSVVSQASS